MRSPSVVFLCAILASGPGLADDHVSGRSWGYRLGVTQPPRQGNFCNDRDSAMEIAGIFQRFGPRTGFSALAGSPDCSTRVHGVTPQGLIRQVRIPLEGGGDYYVNFIQVQADDGSRPVLVTTRRLIGE